MRSDIKIRLWAAFAGLVVGTVAFWLLKPAPVTVPYPKPTTPTVSPAAHGIPMPSLRVGSHGTY